MLRIVDHRLEGCWYRQSPFTSGPLRQPTLIVMHYTAGAAGAADWLCDPRAKASAHLVVARDGSIKQIVPFNVRAWHAGASAWRGRPHCNAFSIGIEIENWGYLFKRRDGHWYSERGGRVAADRVVAARHKNGGPWEGWEAYTPEQLDAVEALTRTLLEEYPSIVGIAGHDDVSPRLKWDPGPAFPIERFQALVAPRSAELRTRTPLTSKTNTALVAGATGLTAVADQGDELARVVQDVLPHGVAAAASPGLIRWVLVGLALLPVIYALLRLVRKQRRGELVNT